MPNLTITSESGANDIPRAKSEESRVADDSIASALCNVLLKSPKADDALLLYRYASYGGHLFGEDR